MLIHNVDGESTAIGPQATSPDKEEEEEEEVKHEKQKPIEPVRKPSSKASQRQSKRSSPLKEEKQSDSESERLHLPAIRPHSVASGIKSPYSSSVRATTPKGKFGVSLPHLYTQEPRQGSLFGHTFASGFVPNKLHQRVLS